MPRRTLEETLEALSRLRDGPITDDGIEELRRAIRSKSSFAAARAAEIAGERGIATLATDLAAAFERFLVDPLKNDKACRAKIAIADALLRLDADATDVFLRGARHVQLEPVWGGKADTAIELRSISAAGLVQSGYPDAPAELALLLADEAAPVRGAAARAIGCTTPHAGVPILRYKALIGDEDPLVVSECMGGLLNLDPEGSIPFVAGFLDRPDLADLAAIALGASRRIEAFPVLKSWLDRTDDPQRRRAGFLAIATLRHDEAIDFLFEMIESADAQTAVLVVGALEIFFDDERFRDRVREAVKKRGGLRLPQEIEEKLAG
ncbi:MAG TPA: HEAT repeat domain-containing protein [Planctomycetota bacterium]|nr:HEAT repeat domain-containing protein [Planctomycetota bacterium]